MNRSSNRSSSTERPCGLTSLLPLGMSCRGRAEAFARSLQSRLRTLGTQVIIQRSACVPKISCINKSFFFFGFSLGWSNGTGERHHS